MAAHGQWVLATVRGELRATREQALTILLQKKRRRPGASWKLASFTAALP